MNTKPGEYRRRRVLHIGKYFPPYRGGIETVLQDQMNMQTRSGDLSVAAVVHSSDRRLIDKVELQPLGYRVRFAARWFTAVFAPIAPFFLWSVYVETKELNPEEIRIHMPNVSAFWLLLMPVMSNRDWVIQWHSDVLPSEHSTFLRCFFWLYRPLETRLLKKAKTIIVSSPDYLASSTTLRPYHAKCSVERITLDKTRIPKTALDQPQPPKTNPAELRVLCVGRLTYYKDFGTAILAVSKIPNATLRIVGSGAEEQKLSSLIKDLKLQDRVTMLGEVSDQELWAQYRWCDKLCLPSIERTEAFGVVILEAALFGKSSVVADTAGSGMGYVATTCDPSGTTFKAGDPAELAKALRGAGD